MTKISTWLFLAILPAVAAGPTVRLERDSLIVNGKPANFSGGWIKLARNGSSYAAVKTLTGEALIRGPWGTERVMLGGPNDVTVYMQNSKASMLAAKEQGEKLNPKQKLSGSFDVVRISDVTMNGRVVWVLYAMTEGSLGTVVKFERGANSWTARTYKVPGLDMPQSIAVHGQTVYITSPSGVVPYDTGGKQ